MGEHTEALGDVHRALVIGVGASGVAAIEALVGAGVDTLATDKRAGAPGLDEARRLGARVVHEATPDALTGVDLVVPSPGVAEHAPLLRAALDRGVPVWSEPELGWRLRPRRVLAVTGTNGKTSTTRLLAEMLVADGVDAHACGNIGRPFTPAAAATRPGATLVAELSSFQLRFCHTLRPEVGMLLNLAPDHLDWHGDVEAYARAKARLWRAQRPEDWAIVNADDPATLDLAAAHAPGRVAVFSGTGTGDPRHPVGTRVVGRALVSTVPEREGELLDVEELAVTAPHHRANVAAAATAALLAGATASAVGRAARAFRLGPHRLEVVGAAGGVTWVDDSKATNVHAAAAALGSFDAVVWVAGGLAKGVDLSVLGEHLGPVQHAVLLGRAAGELAAVCAASEVPVTRAGSMEEAVKVAARLARPGDTVLLAPACSSHDQFRDYAERGERFAAAVRRQVEATRDGA